MPTQKELEQLALDEFAAYEGKLLLASYVGGFEGEDSHDWYLSPPVLVRVVETSKDSILHWNDPDFLDPYWEVEILEDRPELKNGRSFWVDGPSRNLRGDSDRVHWSKATVVPANEPRIW